MRLAVRPARGTARRLLLLPPLLAVLVLVAVLPPAAADKTPPAQSRATTAARSGSAPSPPASARPPAPARLVLRSLGPAIARPGGTLRVTGEVTNTGTEILTSPQVRLRLSRTPLDSRGELTRVAAGETTSRDGRRVAAQELSNLAPGQRADFDVSVALDDLPLREFGVYVLGVELRGGHEGSVERVALVRTFLPWVPAIQQFKATRVAWLWPLVGVPRRTGPGAFPDDSLGAELAPGGRLSTLVQAAAGRPVTWVVDPELLESVAAMAAGYTVASPDGSPAAGTSAETARRWLASLRRAVRGAEVVSLPYADPDVVALRAGRLDGDVLSAATAGAALATKILQRAVRTDVAWPPGGQSDPATLSLLRTAGARAVVLDGRALPPAGAPVATPTGRATIGSGPAALEALLADPTLSQIAAERPGAGDLALTVRRFAAETAMVTAELPSRARTLLVAPPRLWAPPPGFAAALLAASTRVPWAAGATLTDLRSAQPPELDRAALRYSRRAAGNALPADYVAGLRTARSEIGRFASALSAPERLVPDYDSALLRLESAQWRGRPARAGRLRQLRSSLRSVSARVRVFPSSVTLGSQSGTFPLTISNGLDQPVSLRISLEPRSTRLRVGGSSEVLVLPARRRTQLAIPARAVANGLVLVDAQLRTPGAEPYGPPVVLRVRVTQYGTVALWVIGAAGAVLVAAAVLRLRRRRTRPPPVVPAPARSAAIGPAAAVRQPLEADHR